MSTGQPATKLTLMIIVLSIWEEMVPSLHSMLMYTGNIYILEIRLEMLASNLCADHTLGLATSVGSSAGHYFHQVKSISSKTSLETLFMTFATSMQISSLDLLKPRESSYIKWTEQRYLCHLVGGTK